MSFGKTLLSITLSLLIISLAGASYLTPTTNLDILKQQIIQYHDGGAYIYDISQVANRAQNYLSKRVMENKALKEPKKLAIVLDIDETSLFNYKEFEALRSDNSKKMQNSVSVAPDDPAIEPTLNLYKYAISHNVVVFFITGRTEETRGVTIKNLVNVGYTSVKDSKGNCENSPVSDKCLLYFRDDKFLNTSAIPYKATMRKKIEDAGYTIIINIGDQYSDLSGGYSERTYKYPNYLYYVK